MLHDTLESLKPALSNAHSEVEIIIVNNNSTDNTDNIIREAMCSMPIRQFFEPNPGVSNARNTAIKAANGEFLIWTDDDVIVHPNWIRAYECAFKRYPDITFFGGPILPKPESNSPEWLPAALDRIPYAYSILNLGKQPLQIMEQTLLYEQVFSVYLIMMQNLAVSLLIFGSQGRKQKYNNQCLMLVIKAGGYLMHVLNIDYQRIV